MNLLSSCNDSWPFLCTKQLPRVPAPAQEPALWFNHALYMGCSAGLGYIDRSLGKLLLPPLDSLHLQSQFLCKSRCNPAVNVI